MVAVAAEAGPLPSRADKAAITQWAVQTLVDPYSLRSTAISDVTVVDGRQIVCVEFNARNNYGGYEGVQRTTFVVTPEGLIHGSRARPVTTTATCYAAGVVMRPFPELASIR